MIKAWNMSRRKHALLISKQDESYETQVNVIHKIKYVQITSQWNLMTIGTLNHDRLKC